MEWFLLGWVGFEMVAKFFFFFLNIFYLFFVFFLFFLLFSWFVVFLRVLFVGSLV